MMPSNGRFPRTGSANPDKRVVVRLALFAILGLYVAGVVAIHPTNFFGLTEDDSIYMSSAKALAEGRGYVLYSVPGTPVATKYPILYPWLLSWIWRWQPAFPANLSYAIALNVAFGCGYLTAAFLLLRKIGHLSDCEALAILTFCALHPVILFHSACLLSDIPFAALVLGALLFAGNLIREEDEAFSGVASGVFTGLALLVRALGVPVMAALGLAILLRRGWRGCRWFGAGALPFVALWLGWSALHRPGTELLDASAACSRVWHTGWLYYTDYLGFWKDDVLQGHVFWQVGRQNLIALLLQPGSYVIEPGFVRPGVLAFAPAAILSTAAVRGLLMRLNDTHRGLVLWVVAFYGAPLLLWDYSVMARFLIPFLPLLAAGAWLQTKEVLERVVKSVQTGGLKREGFPLVFLSVCIGTLILGASWSLWAGDRALIRGSRARAAIETDKREAYAWVRKNSTRETRVVAYEDAAQYLYSGRQAIRPVIFSPSGVIRPEQLESEVACLTEAGAIVHADYWVIADDDFGFEWEPAVSLGRDREKEYERILPLAFRSGRGRVRVYMLGTAPKP